MVRKLVRGFTIILFYMLLVYVFKHQNYIFPIFMIASFFLAMSLRTKKDVFLAFLPLTINFIIHLFLEGNQSNITIIYILFIPVTFSLGYFLKNKKWYYKTIYPIVVMLIGFYGFTNLYYLERNYNARDKTKSPEIVLFTSDNIPVRIDTIKDKLIVLDFWTTSCGVCFKKFPDYEKVYLEFKENPSVELYAVNVPIRRDTIGKAKKIIEEYKYQFPVLYAKNDSISKVLGFNKYPHLIMVYNNEIRFNGIAPLDDKLFINELADEINMILQE